MYIVHWGLLPASLLLKCQFFDIDKLEELCNAAFKCFSVLLIFLLVNAAPQEGGGGLIGPSVPYYLYYVVWIVGG